MSGDDNPEKKRRLDLAGGSAPGGSDDVSASLAKLRAAAQSAIDSIALSMLGGAGAAGSSTAKAAEPPKVEAAPAVPDFAPPADPPPEAEPEKPKAEPEKAPVFGAALAVSLDATALEHMGMTNTTQSSVQAHLNFASSQLSGLPETGETTFEAAGPSWGGSSSVFASPAPAPALAPAPAAAAAPKPGSLDEALAMMHAAETGGFQSAASTAGYGAFAGSAPQGSAPASGLGYVDQTAASSSSLAIPAGIARLTAQFQEPPPTHPAGGLDVPPGLQSLMASQQPQQPQAPVSDPALDAAAAAVAAGISSDPGQAAGQMYMLAQLAEESSQTAASAAACVPGATETNPEQVSALAQAAEQAAQRATWAYTTLMQCFPEPPGPPQGEQEEWMANLRSLTRQSSEAAEAASNQCKVAVGEMAVKLGGMLMGKSKVPCKWFLLGQCRKSICEFSHNIDDLQPRPLHKKRAEVCHYFNKGQCTRGTACPFAHGADELAEITRIVSDLKTEKKMFQRTGMQIGMGMLGGGAGR